MLTDRPRIGREVISGIGERDDAWNEKQDIEREIKSRLQPRLEKTIEHIATHMAVFGQGVRACHHE